LAISALDHFEIEPGLLDFCADSRLADSFDGHDGTIAHGSDGQHARAHRPSIDVHRAGATLCDTTAEFCAGHAENIAKGPKQRHIGRCIKRPLLAIDRQSYHGAPDF
jgi:hypothetical protein